MSCTFSIAVTPIMSSGTLTGLSVQGTVFFGPGTHCPDVTVRVRCGHANVEGVAPVYLWTPNYGSWQYDFTNLPAGILACCGHNITVIVGCPQCGYQTFLYPLYCEATKCPTFHSINCQIGPCKPDGTVDVQVAAQVSLGSAPVTMQWFLDNVPLGAPFSVASSGQVNLNQSITGDGSSHQLMLQIIDPPGCPPIGCIVVVPACSKPCPSIKIFHSVSKCKADGMHDVIVTAVLTSSAPNATITATMNGPFGPTSGTGTGTLTLTQNGPLGSGTYSVTVSAPGCPAESYSFTVEDCCPTVDFAYVVCGDPICGGVGERPVHITATVTPRPGVQTTATLIDTDSGATLASGSGTTPFTLTATGNYGSGTHQVSVSFSAPKNCPDKTYEFCVPDCEKLSCLKLHALIIVSGSVALFQLTLIGIAAAAAALISSFPFLGFLLQNYIGLAAIIGAGWFNAVLIAASATFLGSLIWWWLCVSWFGVHFGACCGTKCLWRVIAWQITLMVAVLLLYFLAVCFLLTILVAILFLILAYILCARWQKKCCVGKCDLLFYAVMAMLLVFMQALTLVLATNLDSVIQSAPLWMRIVNYIVALWLGLKTLSLLLGLSQCKGNC